MVETPGIAQGGAPAIDSALEAVTALHRAGRLEEARAACRELIARHPGESEPHFREGLVEAELGSLASAKEAIGRALALRDKPNYRYALGDIQERLGDRAGAIESWRRAVTLQPALSLAHVRLGIALQESGELAQAIAHFVFAVQSRPEDARAWNNLAAALLSQGNVAQAEIAARQALAIDPRHPTANLNLGRALLAQRRPAEAVPVLEQAVDSAPRDARAWDLLGMGRAEAGALLAGKEAFARSVQLDATLAASWVRLGEASLGLGLCGEAVEAYRRAEALGPPGAAQIGSARLFAMQHDGTHGRAEVFEAHRAWAARYAPASPRPAFGNTRDPERPLRIGYVSARFRESSAAFLLAPVIANHDRARFGIHCYAQQDVEDAVTARIRSSGVHWVDARPLGDRELAARMRDDGIDIAIDLAGHTPGHRLPAFAWGPAPVTGTWLDYFNTTGLEGIDFLVTDAIHSPPGDAQPFTERLARLPACRYCWEPPAYAPPVAAVPLARGAGAPVFGSFNRMAKLSPATLEAWCALLRRVPGARLVLKNASLGRAAEQAFFSGWFRERGVDPARIEWQGADSHEAALAQYAGIDVVLDTFPYNGGLTTLEALWMGRPVVTVAGDTLISRQSKAILSAAGLPELCADDAGAFVDIAAGLVADATRLSALSGSLRERVRASALLDHARFTRDLEDLYRAEWKRWCAAAV
jgi:protein O-GlcNAc transferase